MSLLKKMLPKAPFNGLAHHPFLRNNLIFFIGSITAGLLNYLFYPILSRMLSISAFGEVQVLVSMFTQVAIFLVAVSLVTANIAANIDDVLQRNSIIFELEKLVLYILSIFTFTALILVVPLQQFLRLSSPWPITALLLAIAFGVPLTFNMAYLQGRKRFYDISMVSILAAGLDLLLAVVFVMIGLGPFGATSALAIGHGLGWIIARRNARQAGYRWPAKLKGRSLNLSQIKPQLRYGGLVLIVSLVVTLLYSGDIIVIKHFFTPEQAGAYAGIAVVARIIIFLTGSITGVMFSALKIEASERDNANILKFSAALLTLIGGVALLVFALLPRLIIRVLIGGRYLGLAGLLPQLSLAMFMISFVNLLFIYHLALRHRFTAQVALFGGAATLILLILRHDSMANVIYDLIGGSTIILVSMLAWRLAAASKPAVYLSQS